MLGRRGWLGGGGGGGGERNVCNRRLAVVNLFFFFFFFKGLVKSVILFTTSVLYLSHCINIQF